MTVIASAKLNGLGPDDSAPVECRWKGAPLRISPAVLPCLALLGLFLLKPNRRIQAWLVWLPVLAIWGIVLALEKWVADSNEALSILLRLFPNALAFGWAASLLLPQFESLRRRVPRFVGLLAGLGSFSLLRLATSQEWRSETLMDIVCAVSLLFMVFGIAAALNLAGYFARDGFANRRLIGWFVLSSPVIWLLFAFPLATLSVVENRQTLGAILAFAGMCCLISLLTSLPFLALAAASPWHKRRLVELLAHSELVRGQFDKGTY